MKMKMRMYKNNLAAQALLAAASLSCLSGCDTRENMFIEDDYDYGLPRVEVEVVLTDLHGNSDTARSSAYSDYSVDCCSRNMLALRFSNDSIFTEKKRIMVSSVLVDGQKMNFRLRGEDGLDDPLKDGSFFVGGDVVNAWYGASAISNKADGSPCAINASGRDLSIHVGSLQSPIYLHATFPCPGFSRPVSSLVVQSVPGFPMKRDLDLSGSSLCDGEVLKYEWCIDGNVVDNLSPGFESDSLYAGGKAAYGGTYVTATSQKCIRHAFQVPGYHTVYYRCLGSNGVWDRWHSEIVFIYDDK